MRRVPEVLASVSFESICTVGRNGPVSPSSLMVSSETKSTGLDRAISDVRLARGMQFDVRREQLSGTILRLEVLRLAISEVIAGRREAKQFIDLQLLGGDKPRLWIDLVSYVVMAPSARHYQLVRDRQDNCEILLETDNLDDMIAYLTSYIANRILVRERQLVTDDAAVLNVLNTVKKSVQKPVRTYSTLALIFAWFCGVFLGVVGLFTFGVWFAGV